MKPDLAAFRLLTPAAQLDRIRGTRAERVFQVDRAGIDEKKRTAWLSIASSAPYQRWWGCETLDVSTKAINDERLRAGAPLLVNHRVEDHVGVIEDFAIIRGKLRVLARFGRGARAEEIWQDVLDGIRVSTSVGYIIDDLVLEKQEDGINHYRVTSWTPLEGSLASVPADISVGVGRSRINPKGQVMEQEHEEEVPSTRRERVAARDGGADAETKRIAALYQAGQEYAQHGGAEVAAKIIARKDLNYSQSVEVFRIHMLEKMTTKTPPTNTAQPFEEPHQYGEGARQVITMSKLAREVYGDTEEGRARGHREGMWVQGLIGKTIPQHRSEKVERYLREHGLERSMSEGVGTEGGFLVPGENHMTIIDLRDHVGVFRQNSDVIPMGSDSLNMARSDSDPEAQFVAENGAIPEDKGAWGNINFVAKKIGVTTRISTELLDDAVIDVAARAAFQIARAFAKKEDQCGFLGDGTSTFGGMQGIFPTLEDGSHAGGVVAVNAAHDTFSEIDATDLARVMASLPEYAFDGAKWYCSHVCWSMVFWRLMAAASGNAASDIAGKIERAYAGFPVVTSAELPSGTTTDYSGSLLLAFGNLQKSSKFGSRRDIRMKILTERYADYDQIGVQATERFHIVNHDLGNDVTAGPMVGLIGGAS